jgi:hypothetical protein
LFVGAKVVFLVHDQNNQAHSKQILRATPVE